MAVKEIPVLFPNNNTDSPPRYVVDLRESRLAIADPTLGSDARLSNGGGLAVDEALAEAANISEIQLKDKDFVVTTNALVEQPDIISVALFPKRGSEELGPPKILELSTQDLVVVAIRAFTDENPPSNAAPLSPPVFHLVLVGSQGIIVSLRLDENLCPDSNNPVKFLFTEDYVPGALQSSIAGTSLRPTMVDFLSSKKHPVVLALAPSLLAVDWMGSGRCEVWTESQCREDMKGFPTVLGLFGSIDDGVVDMAPTAALCVSSNKLKGSGAADVVFTIHSDSRIRKWLVDPIKTLRPYHVTITVANQLPSPSSWSDARNSVVMCARLYGDVFALGVYIKTDPVVADESNCNIWAFDGAASSSFDGSIELTVPSKVKNVIGMAFNPIDSRCSLRAMFESSVIGSSGSKATVEIVTYPHSNAYIVGSQPDHTETDDLDQIAKRELDRIDALSYGETVLAEISAEDSMPSVDEVLNAMDGFFLKFLFKPTFPRGSGTVIPPSDDCIRRALAKLVSHRRREQAMSIELETIKALYEWRKRDKELEKASSYGIGTGQDSSITLQYMAESVYESYVATTHDDSPMGTDRSDVILPENEPEADLLPEIASHQNRWKQLLRHIWEEEQVLRRPVHASWLQGFHLPILVRGGVLSVVVEANEAGKVEGDLSVLDDAGHQMVSLIEADPSKCRHLHQTEERLFTYVSQFLLEPFKSSYIENEMTFLGRWAGFKRGGFHEIKSILSKMSARDVINWIDRKPRHTIGSCDADMAAVDNMERDEIPNLHFRHATCNSVVRAIDNIRRDRLGKYLVLCAVGTDVGTAALRAYMNAIAVLWSSSQRVNLPLDSKRDGSSIARFNESRVPTTAFTYPSFGINSGILRPRSTATTVLDAVVISSLKDLTATNHKVSFPYGVVRVADGFASTVFPEAGKAESIMTELYALPRNSDDINDSEFSVLALRLLAPFTKLVQSSDSEESVYARTKEMSKCLLHAARTEAFLPGQKMKMVEMASQLQSTHVLLARNDQNIDMIGKGVEFLSQSKQKHKRSDNAKKLLALLNDLLPAVATKEIETIAELECSRHLFSCVETVDESHRPNLQAVAQGFLLLSRILFRVQLFKEHVTNIGAEDYVVRENNSRHLMDVISDAIREIEATFPESFVLETSEYRSLWVTKFQVALGSARWNEAFDTCFKRPLAKNRDKNLATLVRNMVEKGGLLDLIRFCRPFRAGGSGDVVDLYPIAFDVLLENSAKQDNYRARAEAKHTTDYQGALYALHASQLQWQRAAQALSLRYQKAMECFNTENTSLVMQLRNALVVKDLVLASSAAANAILLVKDPMSRFVTTGSYAWYSAHIPNNPGHSQYNDDSTSEHGEQNDCFGGVTFLETQAVKAIGLRNIYFDGCMNQANAHRDFCKSFNVPEEIEMVVGVLFETGYYHKGLVLAKKMGEYFRDISGRAKDKGIDSFAESVTNLVRTLLIPLSFNKEKAIDQVRPTSNQLRIANEALGKAPKEPFFASGTRSSPLALLSEAAFHSALSALIRSLTMEFSTAETPIALDVAECILQQNDNARVPVWLEGMLLGSGVNASISGAFAPRPVSGCQEYLGNPAGLLSLYTNEGLFCEACDLVSFVLDHHCDRFESMDLRIGRRPAKGDVDYVPYDSIDKLYDLIQVTAGRLGAGIEKEKLLQARDSMVQALKRFSELLKINEKGLEATAKY